MKLVKLENIKMRLGVLIIWIMMKKMIIIFVKMAKLFANKIINRKSKTGYKSKITCYTCKECRDC